MTEFAQWLVDHQVAGLQHLGAGWTNLLLMFAIGAFLLGGLFMPIGGILTWVERKIAGFTQSRIGPNRVGPFGLAQFLADGIKLILKEDITPAAVDKPLFKMAPYAVVGGAFMVMAVLPLGPNLLVADTSLGLLVYLAASSFVTMGIVMSGWSSNNKWSTMGGARSVAQIVSYEIPVALSLLPLVLLSGSLRFQDFAKMQGGWPWQWNCFANPGTFLCTFCYFIAALAEINRTPFDIPEAESELVSGYNTEYSGMRFGMFFVAEFANVWVISMITALCFLGAWHFPGENWLLAHIYPLDANRIPLALTLTGALEHHSLGAFVLYNALGHLTVMAKASVGVVLIVLLRWTLPRVRVDQLMNICWKYLVPITLGSAFLTALWMILPWPALTWFRYDWTAPVRPTWNQGYWPGFVILGLLLCGGWLLKVLRENKRDKKKATRSPKATAGRPAWEEVPGVSRG